MPAQASDGSPLPMGRPFVVGRPAAPISFRPRRGRSGTPGGERVSSRRWKMLLEVQRRLRSPFVRRLARRNDASSGGEAGFTLIEMLVVITIIGLVMALVGPRVLNYLSDSKVKAAKIQIESFEAALDLYYLDNGSYPASNEGLKALVQRPASAAAWNGPYLKAGAVPEDPWGHPYVYKVPGDRSPYEIASYGTGQIGDTQTMIKSTMR